MSRFVYFFHPKFPIYLIYMLQQVEYNPGSFIKWLFRLPILPKIMHRQVIVWTNKAKMLSVMTYAFWLWYILTAIIIAFYSPFLGIIVFLIAPFLTIGVLYLAVLLAWLWLEQPRRESQLKKAKRMFKKHPGIKIAIAGSYGKTSMKELLLAVLGQSKKVAATPGNKNVPISHARWAQKLDGNEEILIIEYGEGAPGDIARFAHITHPDYGIVTGLAPNHLDGYKTLKAVADDLLDLKKFTAAEKLFINADGKSFESYDISKFQQYSRQGVLGWKIRNIKVDLDGTSFDMVRKKRELHIKSGLLGVHQVAPIALSVALADRLGVTEKAIVDGIAGTRAFEHRMQLKHLGGGWIIDDAYNGNLEGIRAGLQLITDLKADRKIYVTPGLVDQGEETERVHREIGKLISAASPEKVVLMQNSVLNFMREELEKSGYKGELQIIDDPLEFYANLEHFIAAGDLIMLQNDWTDNYS